MLCFIFISLWVTSPRWIRSNIHVWHIESFLISDHVSPLCCCGCERLEVALHAVIEPLDGLWLLELPVSPAPGGTWPLVSKLSFSPFKVRKLFSTISKLSNLISEIIVSLSVWSWRRLCPWIRNPLQRRQQPLYQSLCSVDDYEDTWATSQTKQRTGIYYLLITMELLLPPRTWTFLFLEFVGNS